MRKHEETLLIQGPVGPIETIVEIPSTPTALAPTLRGIALIAHPHPLFGGANTNKVAHALARTFTALGYAALRPNFRGVGQSSGQHDEGNGETADLLHLITVAKQRFGQLPIVLAGFSFGAFVQTRVAQQLALDGHPAQRLVLVGTAAGYVEGTRSYDTAAVPPDTLIIHGAKDETVPLNNVLQWAEPLELPVIVVPGADHFFHRRLHIIRNIITQAWPHPTPS